jgi:hypothetical protein
LRSPFDIFYYFSPRRTGVFPLQTGVYAALININALVKRDSLYLGRIFRAFLF